MRGKVYGCSSLINVVRITPAYAGKSKAAVSFAISLQDHPRLCGEKLLLPLSETLQWGSPPPMRGKAKAAGTNKSEDRITPAYAGKRCAYRV